MPKKKNGRSRKNCSKGKSKIRTVSASPSAASHLLAGAIEAYDRFDFRAARKKFCKIIKGDAHHSDAYYYLGCILHDQGKTDDAVNCFTRVIALDTSRVDAYFKLGNILIDQGNYEPAKRQFRAVLSVAPGETNALYNLGVIAALEGKTEEAIGYYDKVLEIDPAYVNAHYNKGCLYMGGGEFDKAQECFKKTLAIDPHYIDALFNLGFMANEREDHAKAVEYYEAVLTLDANYSLAYNNLGILYQADNMLEKAREYYEKALSADPSLSDAHLNMGNLLRGCGDLTGAAEYYRKSIRLKPSLVGLMNLAGLDKELCEYDEAYAVIMNALQYGQLKKSDLANIHDTFIQICEWERAGDVIKRFKTTPVDPEGKDVLAGSFMEFCAITELSLDEIAEQHKVWGRLTEEKVMPFPCRLQNQPVPERRKIRIGYSSPDLREHSVGYLIKDIITSHNYDEFEVYCYANFDPKDRDAFTQEMINSSTLFKYVKHLSDRQLAEEIYNDHIDILIDLAGHTAGHRLRSFAYKPAPIQITYLGYPNTTGLSRMDYRISDRYAEAEGKDHRYTEKLLRLTNCFLSFRGFGAVVPCVMNPKRKTTDQVVFGCFNNIQKLNPKVVELWSRILKEVENSTIHLKAKQLNTPMVWNNIVNEFAQHKISSDRLICLGYTPTREEHLQLYNTVDISLDTFPYNGTVTTLEALWMNVPVVTLVGESHAQRVGYSILKNLNLDQLIAFSEDEYVSIAVNLATHADRIDILKTKMRKRLLASSICNPRVITREMELYYKKIWMEDMINAEREHFADRDRSASEAGVADHSIAAASRLRMAMVKLQIEEYEEAIAVCSELVNDETVSSLAYYIQGVSYKKLGKEQKAIEALKESLNKDSDNSGAWELLGNIYLAKDKTDEASACFARLPSHEHDSAEIY
ncbi:MAG: tetratricopeptide repeat protein [Deltaproteobacteria bacterium]|nr:tetratricopeptide repeat protein [Deltaproteobacteria bacterium]